MWRYLANVPKPVLKKQQLSDDKHEQDKLCEGREAENMTGTLEKGRTGFIAINRKTMFCSLCRKYGKQKNCTVHCRRRQFLTRECFY